MRLPTIPGQARRRRAAAPRTAAEQDFCARRLAQRDETTARTCIALAVPYHFVSLFTDRFMVADEDAPLFFLMHLFLLAAHTLWYMKIQYTRVRTAHYLWPLQVLFVGFLAHILHRSGARGNDADAVLAASGLALVSGIMILTCPFRGRWLGATAALYWALGAASIQGNAIGARWLVVSGLVLIAVAYAQHLSNEKTRTLALAEYRTLRLIAPEQVVRSAAGADGASLELLFRPTMRPVACVSTDWRGYQAYSRGHEPREVASTLSEYYELCAQILREVAPDGNFYTDWIADELFIVFFGRPGSSTRNLVRQAVRFSKRLVAEKPGFLATHAMPTALDIGVATGLAYVGLMGSSDHRKATALGDVPGTSRRLQATGKLLRARLGADDRIIIDDQTADWLASEVTVRTYELGPRETLRDLDERVVRYLPSDSALSSEGDVDAA